MGRKRVQYKAKEEYEILETMVNEVIDTHQYSETVHVIQRDESFKTLRNFGIEKYANGVGLVYARQVFWTKKAIGDTTEIPQGYDYTYTLKTFEE